MIESPRADGQNLADELPAHQGFENFAGLDAVDRNAEHDEIGKLAVKHRCEVIGLGAFAGDKAEILQHLGQECAKVFLAVRHAGPRRHLSASERCGSGYIFVVQLTCHLLMPPDAGRVLTPRMVSNEENFSVQN